MNYRHAFHAGNFADVMKHALLLRILVHLRAKPAPFRVLDSHAGLGLYDLSGEQAGRTGEWRDGVGRCEAPFDGAVEELLAPYRDVLRSVRDRHGPEVYPGSPAILRETLRLQDRAILIEKHPDDGAALHARYNAVSNLKVLQADGWTALGGLVPPRERRGLVFIDPPYEEPGELARASARLAALARRWPTGIYALWYPIKSSEPVERFYESLAGSAAAVPNLRLELLIHPPVDPGRLNGCGLAVLNPPWRLAEEAAVLLPALADRLGREGEGGWRVHPRPTA